MSATDKSKLDGIEEGAQANIKPDWNAASQTAAEILNKPPIPLFMKIGNANGVSVIGGNGFSEITSLGFNILGMCYGNDIFVAIGWSQYSDVLCIATSPDGIVWTKRDSGTNKSLKGIIFANGLFVIVAENSVLTSSDGIYWTSYGNDMTYPTGIAYGKGLYVIIGESGLLATSPDLNNWTMHDVGVSTDFRAIYFTGQRFFAVGDFRYIFQSDDGISWNALPLQTQVNSLSAVTYGQYCVVAVGSDGCILYIDQDGHERSSSISDQDLNGISFLPDNTFMVVGNSGTVFTTPDIKSSWTKLDVGVSYDLNVISFATLSANDNTLSANDNRVLIGAKDGHILLHEPTEYVVFGNLATTDTVGVVKPDGTSIKIKDGIISINNEALEAAVLKVLKRVGIEVPNQLKLT
jgi:hypothetical protein